MSTSSAHCAGEDAARGLWSAWADGYQFKADNVILSYSSTSSVTTAAEQLASGAVAFVSVDGLIGEADRASFPSETTEVPVAGGAIVVAYNLPGNSSLVLDGVTLARVWHGEIRQWNDSAIATLNPNATLPSNDITMSFAASGSDGITRLFRRALAAFNSTFTSADPAFADLLPALEGRTYSAASATDRLDYVKNTAYSMTYVEYSSTVRGTLAYFSMKNRANKAVTPSTASVQAAMTDYAAALNSGDLTGDIFNGPGTNSWPMAYVVVASVRSSFTPSDGDCTVIQSLVELLSWTQVNDRAASAITTAKFFPLTTPYFKRVIDQLGSVVCGGSRALGDTAFLIGQGSSLQSVNDWVQAYSSDEFVLKYFTSNTVTALNSLAKGDLDFALGVKAGFGVAGLEQVQVFEGVTFGVFPVYNIPELVAYPALVLNTSILVDVYLNRVTYWDDPKIVALNPAHPLPHMPIRTIMQTSLSYITSVFTSALSAFDAEFNSTVGTAYNVSFPIQTANSNTLSVALSAAPLLALCGTTPYSLTWTQSGNVNRNATRFSMVNMLGNVVSVNATTVLSAVASQTNSTNGLYILSTGADSWPIVASLPFLLPLSSTVDCQKATALVDWIYWVSTSSQAFRLAARTDAVSSGQVPELQKRLLRSLSNVTCDGRHVLSAWSCISDGELCSGAGTCVEGKCNCDEGLVGTYCQMNATVSSSSDDPLTITLAVALPVAFVGVACMTGMLVLVFLLARRGRSRREEWDIDWNDLEVGEELGMGGHGEVFKAKWRGTEVAVKMLAANVTVTKDMQRCFAGEVEVMAKLRHPNVVLFMAASTKPPKMCIVMEFMALGSLYDLLHNELIPELPFKLKIKMAFQAAKGMHFLHSSGIVHRDLKSLNLLLDAKWNVKVSDFGLTKFKSDMALGGGAGADNKGLGTIHWTAPEVLNESHDIDHVLADVYSFGIILWELLTRQQPYLGLSPAAVAVAVIRDGLRPKITAADVSEETHEFVELMKTCWHEDPTIRPTFLEIMTRLSSSVDKSRSSFTSRTSSSSSNSDSKVRSTSSIPTVSSSSSASSRASSGRGVAAFRPPEGEVAIVFTDITRAASLWEHNPAAMRDATMAHNDLMRSLIARHGGYEAGTGRERNTGEGSFCVVFTRAHDALRWCADVQRALLTVAWPDGLLTHPGAAEELWDGGYDERVVFRGLRVRMGVHAGHPRVLRDAMTRRVEYVGSTVNAAARMTALAHGGQVVVSQQARDKLATEAPATPGQSDQARAETENHNKRLKRLGRFELPDSPAGTMLYELKVAGLERRFFGGVSVEKDDDGTSDGSPEASHSSGSGKSHDGGESREVQEVVGEGMAFKEDQFLTSANLCRWVIDFKVVQLGDQVGMGSYGVVHRGKWKGVEVAVKKFIKQKLDERRMLEFRAEMAFLSELHHPNIVLFIGACMKPPNLCIVTEFVKRGSLGEIISDHTVKLSWVQKMGMLKSAALGINYLHSLSPVIVHRDLKPSNLLVDENWNVKVADFGFARIKEENVTMTRCGTPCWTAPEVIRGEKYSEKADVYSFGVVMWEVATRKQPFAGRNFMGVSLDVLEGKRPKVPSDLPPAFKKLLKRSWHAEANKRPTMEEIIEALDAQAAGALAGSPDNAV